MPGAQAERRGEHDDDVLEEEAAVEAPPTERAPLLPKSSSSSSSTLSQRQKKKQKSGFSLASVTSAIGAPFKARHGNDNGNNGFAVVNILCVMIFLASCSGGLVELPMTRLIEDILCHRYYGVEEGPGPGRDIDESMCKEDAIQKKLAYLLAINGTLFAIVGCLAAFPWGLAADKIGRKPIVALAMTGLLISPLIEMAVVYWHNVFPLSGIWLSCTGQLIGGGNAMLIAVISTMVTDATKEEDRAMAFLRTHISNLCGNMLSPSLAAVVMERTGNLWIAPVLGVSLFAVAGAIFVFLPETMMRKKDHGPTSQYDNNSNSNPSPSNASLPKRAFRQILHQIHEYTTIVTHSPSVILLLLTLLCSVPVLFSTLTFLNQFVSKRYGVTIARTGYVQSAYGITSVFTSLYLLPRLSKFLLLSPSTSPSPSPSSSPHYSQKKKTLAKWKFPDQHTRDLALARTSFLVLFLGSSTLALSPSLPGFVFGLVPLMAFGSGATSLVRSLMSARVDPGHRSRLFSLAGIVEVLGSVYAQPMLAGLFSLGLRLSSSSSSDDGDGNGNGNGGGSGSGSGVWIGLPYLAIAALVATAGLLLLFVRIPSPHDETADEEEGGSPCAGAPEAEVVDEHN